MRNISPPDGPSLAAIWRSRSCASCFIERNLPTMGKGMPPRITTCCKKRRIASLGSKPQDANTAVALAFRSPSIRALITLSFMELHCSYIRSRSQDGGGTTLILTLRMAVPVTLAMCLRTDSVIYRKREAQTAPTTPSVSRPRSIPALTTAAPRRGGRVAWTCSRTRDLSCDRALSAVSLFPVRDNKSLTRLGFCIATRQ